MLSTDYEHDGTAIVTDTDAPGTRWLVFPDTDSDSPVHWHNDAIVKVYAAGCGMARDGATDELSSVFYRVYGEYRDAELALAVTRRYARVIPGWSEERAHECIVTSTIRGYSQSAWWDILVIDYANQGHAEGVAADWGTWARGDVWTVIQEHATVCDKGETHWEAIDIDGSDSHVISGIYADDAESAVATYLQIA